MQTPYFYTGTVTDNQDEEGLNRVKVSAQLEGESMTFWLPYLSAAAGNGTGLSVLPDIDAQVLVLAFGQGRDEQDIPDGTDARIKVVEKDADGNDDDVATLTAKVSGGRIECAWKIVYMEDDDDADSEQEKAEKGYTLPEYAFTVECGGVTSEESGQLDVRGGIKAIIKNKSTKQPLRNKKISLWCGMQKVKELVTDENGYIELIGIGLGKFTIKQKEV